MHSVIFIYHLCLDRQQFRNILVEFKLRLLLIILVECKHEKLDQQRQNYNNIIAQIIKQFVSPITGSLTPLWPAH